MDAGGIRVWLQELFAPVVLVAATPAADGIITARNGLTLVDLLRPYSHVTQLSGKRDVQHMQQEHPQQAFDRAVAVACMVILSV
jgi:hypothetical protein